MSRTIQSFIEQNMDQLVKLTVLSCELSNYLRSSGILTKSECEKLENFRTNGLNYEGATYFYRILQGKLDSSLLDQWLNILYYTRHNALVELFENFWSEIKEPKRYASQLKKWIQTKSAEKPTSEMIEILSNEKIKTSKKKQFENLLNHLQWFEKTYGQSGITFGQFCYIELRRLSFLDQLNELYDPRGYQRYSRAFPVHIPTKAQTEGIPRMELFGLTYLMRNFANCSGIHRGSFLVSLELQGFMAVEYRRSRLSLNKFWTNIFAVAIFEFHFEAPKRGRIPAENFFHPVSLSSDYEHSKVPSDVDKKMLHTVWKDYAENRIMAQMIQEIRQILLHFWHDKSLNFQHDITNLYERYGPASSSDSDSSDEENFTPLNSNTVYPGSSANKSSKNKTSSSGTHRQITTDQIVNAVCIRKSRDKTFLNALLQKIPGVRKGLKVLNSSKVFKRRVLKLPKASRTGKNKENGTFLTYSEHKKLRRSSLP